ncbi:MAG: phytoene desaturase family protein [Promethearchaeota archaeon]
MVVSHREFDVVVVGAGNGGLATTALLSKNGVNVLCLEKHNIPGGFASSFVRGRFEFEASLHVIGEVGAPDNPRMIREFFRDLGINIEWVRVPEAFNIITEEEKINFVMPYGIENTISAIESYYPGTEKHVRRYLALCKEVSDAVGYVESAEGKLNKFHIIKNFPNFLRTASYSVTQVLDALGTPQRVRNLFQGFWGYLATPMKDLNWGLWAMMVYSFIEGEAYIPKMRSTELSVALTNKIYQFGGRVECNSKVSKILVKDRKIWGVETIHGEIIKCKYVISNASPTLVYNYLIQPQSSVPGLAYKNINSRSLSCSGFVLYLGLDKSAKELGFDSYSKVLHKSSNTSNLYNSFSKLKMPEVSISMCLNNILPNSSPEGTSMITITTFIDPNAWKTITPAQYYKTKSMITQKIIKNFEKMTNISITPHIEEIEASTPVTYARYFDSYQGLIYGYGLNSWDHTISRMMMVNDEDYIKGLSFVGAHPTNQAFSSTYGSGIMHAKTIYQKLLKERRLK